MNRIVQPELLDELPPGDARAVASRADLRRINGLMGNSRMVARAVKEFARVSRESDSGDARRTPKILEIGCGDGTVALDVVRRIGGTGTVLLLDRQPCVSPETIRDFESIGWEPRVIAADVFDWMEGTEVVDVIFANLFLHHFREKELRALLDGVATRCRCFVAVEPRRDPLALWFARRVNLIGCNEITRHDADVSVRAGFRDDELTALWPAPWWQLNERRAGMFSHLFAARVR